MLSAQKVSFSRHPQGGLHIEFDDAVFARADVVFFDPGSRELSGLVGHMHFTIGILDEQLARAFTGQDSVLLSAPHPAGHRVSLLAPLATIH